MRSAPPVILGAGLAGLTAALALAPLPVIVLAADALGAGAATAWAQGGIAAAIGADDDAALHLADTLAAGDGLCDAAVARSIVSEAASAIGRLSGWGAAFDATGGTLRLGLEAAHSRRRIVHADGDGTGRHVLDALIAAVRATPSIEVVAHARARRIIRDDDGRVAGVVAERGAGAAPAPFVLRTDRVVIATGGLGGLFALTTNPLGATGSGLALAAAIGCALGDLEFVQFHPTAIDVGRDPMPLASEALRGEGATLIDEAGRRFMLGCEAAAGRAELAPRDVVARAIAAELAAGHNVFLDARDAIGAHFEKRFPGVFALCAASGIDPATMPIPVRPAAHYAMGGIVVDADGRTEIDGLWACGEAACTGLHGANRLASNSLLEATVTGARVARDIAGREAAGRRLRAVAAVPAISPSGCARAIRPIMSAGFGVVRDAGGMQAATEALRALEGRPGLDADAWAVSLMLAAACMSRDESRGAHSRSDAPSHAAVSVRTRITWREAQARLDVPMRGAMRAFA